MLVVRRICDFARDAPAETALIHNLRPISYRAFGDRIGALRRRLAGLDRRPAGAVVLLVDDIAAAWTVDLAVRSLGHTTVSIRTADEFANLLGLDIVAVITLAREPRQPAEATQLPRAHRLVLTDADFEGAPDSEPLAKTPGDHILLTSGTTGRSKMVLRHAAQEEADAEAVRPLYDELAKTQGWRGKMNLFNFGLWTAAGYGAAPLAWSYGQTVIIHQDPDLYRSLTIPGITHATVTPAMLQQLMAAPAGAFPRQEGLQLSLVGGPLSAALFREVRARLTDHITTSVASTEAGTWASTRVKTEDDLRWHRLMRGRTVEIVDDDDRPLPIGQLGQIRVAVAPSAEGYLNDAGTNAAFFRGGWFYPGDLGVLNADGRLAMFGRVTDVLNVMGDKMPARPIEEKLEAALGVSAVCALSEQGQGFAEELHIVIETDTPIDEATLASLAQTELRGFPAASFHFLERLPRNDMGKVERLKLRRLLVARR